MKLKSVIAILFCLLTVAALTQVHSGVKVRSEQLSADEQTSLSNAQGAVDKATIDLANAKRAIAAAHGMTNAPNTQANYWFDFTGNKTVTLYRTCTPELGDTCSKK